MQRQPHFFEWRKRNVVDRTWSWGDEGGQREIRASDDTSLKESVDVAPSCDEMRERLKEVAKRDFAHRRMFRDIRKRGVEHLQMVSASDVLVQRDASGPLHTCAAVYSLAFILQQSLALPFGPSAKLRVACALRAQRRKRLSR
mmetsp:Transcript_39352/g.92048  ORF Transcript_39352/g.92048 Transcript_39352/m.92048 type:complete len:143 (-) Transcript_39352:168-596(-)